MILAFIINISRSSNMFAQFIVSYFIFISVTVWPTYSSKRSGIGQDVVGAPGQYLHILLVSCPQLPFSLLLSSQQINSIQYTLPDLTSCHYLLPPLICSTVNMSADTAAFQAAIYKTPESEDSVFPFEIDISTLIAKTYKDFYKTLLQNYDNLIKWANQIGLTIIYQNHLQTKIAR